MINYKKFPNFYQSILLIIIYLVSAAIIQIIFSIFHIESHHANYLFSNAAVLFILCSYFYIEKRKYFSFSIKKEIHALSLKKLISIILLTLSSLIIIEFLVKLLLRIEVFELINREFETLIESFIHENKLLFIINVILIAPILEEIFFRGIILRGLLKNTTPLIAILLSSILFGVVHGNPTQIIGGFVTGVIIGTIYWKTNSLMLCILIHFLFNSSVVLLELVFTEFYDFYDNEFNSMISLIFALIFLIIYFLKMNMLNSDTYDNNET